MKTLVVLLFALGLTVVNKPAYVNNINIDDEKIHVVFDENMKFNDMVAVKLKLESRNIHLTYDRMKFNKKGFLQEVSYDYRNLNNNKELILVNKTNKNIASE